jgi:flagellar motor switch protein FliM
MSKDTLDQSQVENLRRAVEKSDEGKQAGESKQSPAGAAPGTETEGGATPKAAKPAGTPERTLKERRGKTTSYDFKRPERVGKEQMRAMTSLHEGLARSFGASVSGMLRTMIEVKLASVDQLTYSEFIFSLDNPSCFNVVRPKPLDGNWILDISPSLSYAIVDRMLGGDPNPNEVIRRPLTEIENRLIGRVVRMFLDQLQVSWENIIDLDLELERVESNPQLVQIVPPNEVIILVGLKVQLGRNQGLISLCIPFNTVERFNSQLSNNGWVGYARNKSTPESRDTIAHNVDAAPVRVVVTLARSRVKTGELLGLSVGDIITTEQDAGKPLEISIQDVPKLKGSPGSFKGKKAVRIVQ